MFCYGWDLLQDIKSSTDLELCFNGICASYQRLAPHVQFMALVRGEEVFQEFWLFLQASLGVKPVLGLCSSLLRDGLCEGPQVVQGVRLVTLSETGSLEEAYFKVCKA